MTILSVKDFIELANSTPIRVTLFIVFICLIAISTLFIKEQLEIRRKSRTNQKSIFREIPASMTMTLDELLSYFQTHYNFNISEDSFKLIEKAQELVDKVEKIQVDLNNDLLALQSGIIVNKDSVINKINELGSLVDIVDNELDLMGRLFNHLKEHDETYSEELCDLTSIKDHYKIITKSLFSICISLISELPNSN